MTRKFHSFCIVADDLSGAADCAAAFARVAGPVPVFLGAVQERPACLAIDTDSRAMEPAAAVQATTRAFEGLGSGEGDRLVYKKIDSTLRGHVAPELAAALRAMPQCAGAVVAPAFPEQGRTLIGGRLRIEGRTVDVDLMSTLSTAGLQPSLLASPRGPGRSLASRIEDALEGGARAIVVDAADPDDLALLAAALCAPASRRLLVAGSAGLARALAPHFEAPESQIGHPRSAGVRRGPVLTLVGSFSKASAAQVEQVESSGGAVVIRLDARQWTDGQYSSLRHDTMEQAREVLRGGGNVLFAIGGDVRQPFSRSLVEAMARVAAPWVRYAAACVLTGGDTARAMLTELRVQRLDVRDEFEPGISLARAAAHAATEFVLKAGGFGDPAALQRIIRRFGPQQSH